MTDTARIRNLFVTAGIGISLAIASPAAGSPFRMETVSRPEGTSPCDNMTEFVCATCGHFLEPGTWGPGNIRREDLEACEDYRKQQQQRPSDAGNKR